MKKNRMKKILVLLLMLVIPTIKVDAGFGIPATRGSGQVISGTETVKYSFCGRKNGSYIGSTKTHRYPIKINGATYDAFCIDPGNKTPSNALSCSLFKDEGLSFLFEQRKNGVDDATFNIALRLYALKENLIIKLDQDYDSATNKLNGNVQKSAFIQFYQMDGATPDFSANCGSNYSTNKWDYLYENGRQGQEPTGILKRAYELYQQALAFPGYSDEELSGGVRFTEKVYKAETAEHHIVSDKPLTKADFGEIKCQNCQVVSFDWSGTSGVITVAATCNQDYKVGINPAYEGAGLERGIYACNGIGDDTQTLLMLAEENTPTTGTDEAKIWDEGKIPCPGETCCKTGTEIDPGHIDGTVHNCCEDGGNSEAHEYDLDDLFCKDEDLLVDHYYPKCNTDYYVDEDADLNSKYCKMYCTERVSVEIPGSITATSGRYFQLSTTSKGTKSPYVEGFKRCRIRVQYDIWEDDYYDIVEKEVNNYNLFQEMEAYEKVYEETVNRNTQKLTETLSAKCTAKYHENEVDYLPAGCYDSSCRTKCSAPSVSKPSEPSYSQAVTYELFDFTSGLSKYHHWYTVKINENGRNKSNDIYNYIYIKDSNSYQTKHDKYSAWDIYSEINKLNSWISSNSKNDVNKRSSSCGSTAWYDIVCERTDGGTSAEKKGATSENVRETYQKYIQDSKTANDMYNQAAKEAKELEKDLDKCDYYFSPSGGKLGGPYKGANAEENYDFDASMDFYYTQVYMDNEKGLQLDEQYITFKDTPGCVITGPTAGPDGEDNLYGKRYSNKYKAGNENLKDFKEKTLEYKDDFGKFNADLDEQYDADKLFTHDAKYRAECSWDEGENVYYTLSPNGGASENTDVINFTEHGQEYRLYLSTLDGTYETYWRLIGLGSRQKGTSKGKFDDFFMSQGNTCANESPSETAMFTCKLHVEYEIVLTGYCNGSNGTDTTVNVEDCDPYKEGYNLFTFKVVDSTNLFPNGYSTDAGDVGYNWSSTEKGQAAKREIEARGAADKTYSRENLTYSFVLSPTDMGHIKNYNVEANSEGGYSDFKMDCSCSGDSCVNCKSRFLNELANGNVTYDGQSHSVTGWGNSQTSLDGVRRKYGW